MKAGKYLTTEGREVTVKSRKLPDGLGAREWVITEGHFTHSCHQDYPDLAMKFARLLDGGPFNARYGP